MKRIENQKPIVEEDYKSILGDFVRMWQQNKVGEREASIKTLVRSITSNVRTDNKGSVEVKYIADKKVEADWA